MQKFENRQYLIDLWESRRFKLDQFWEIWYEAYLTMLREEKRKLYKKGNSTVRSPIVGEVVLIEKDEVERGKWPLGTISKIMPSPDGIIRTVEVDMLNGNTLRRAINKIYPLEIGLSESEERHSDVDTDEG
jgi:hypothetical protein